jgi:hypothetical protein
LRFRNRNQTLAVYYSKIKNRLHAMNTKKYHLIIQALIIILAPASPLRPRGGDIPIVQGASYYILDDDELPSLVTFYTFNGTFIEQSRCSYNTLPNIYDNMLDPEAPKPQPTRCTLKPEIDRGYRVWFIHFYDQHNNVIKKYSYNHQQKEICARMSRNTLQLFHFDTLLPYQIEETFPLNLTRLESVQEESLFPCCLLL